MNRVVQYTTHSMREYWNGGEKCMASIHDIIGEVDLVLLFDDMGYDLQVYSLDNGVAYLTCPDLEDEVKE